MIKNLMVILFFFTFLPSIGWCENFQASTHVLLHSLQSAEGVSICSEFVPLENEEVKERFEKEMLLILDNAPQVILWLKRTTRYLPIIDRQLKERNLPIDLRYLAVLESALRPHAQSSKNAVGFWQLMSDTARNYGLQVDDFIDERRDIESSTSAALDYLTDLYQRFNSWSLALAGYNMGEEGLAAEILEQNCKDYYRLYLPLETQRFVLRLAVIKLIMTSPEVYGFPMGLQDYYQPIPTKIYTIDIYTEIPIRLVAQAAGTDFKVVKDLNPKLRGHYLQAGRHRLNLPEETSNGFSSQLQKLASEYNEIIQQRIYVVESGDSLTGIAAKFNIPLSSLLIWNRLDLKKPIHPGERLVILPFENINTGGKRIQDDAMGPEPSEVGVKPDDSE